MNGGQLPTNQLYDIIFREIGGYTSIGMRLLNIALKGPAQFPVVKDGHAMETDQIVSISLYIEYNYSSNL